MSKRYIIAIDQGTTSSRALLFDSKIQLIDLQQQELTQYFPHSGWVEQDPEEIWQSTITTTQNLITKNNLSKKDIASIGITNQRETSIVWDKETGKTLCNAIVWQDRRTTAFCQKLKEQGLEERITEITGLLCDPYFSATKLQWILENIAGAKEKATQNKLLFGTVDAFLLWRFTHGKVHKTDITNASRTLLYDIYKKEWSKELLTLFDIPESMLPQVEGNCHDFGCTAQDIFGFEIEIKSMIGDQQSASVGQACFKKGMLKSTYGTGCFALLNTGDQPVKSNNKLLTTIAYQIDHQLSYALEGSIFIAGAVVQWLRDGLKFFNTAEESGHFAEKANEKSEVYLVPAFVGLGAPYWDSECRGALYGLTRDTSHYDIAKAALESVAYQTYDLLEAMNADWHQAQKSILRADGGMVQSRWTMQCLADILQIPVDTPTIQETTALGAAYLAGKKSGLYPDMAEFSKNWMMAERYEPVMDAQTSDKKYQGWKEAVKKTLTKNS